MAAPMWTRVVRQGCRGLIRGNNLKQTSRNLCSEGGGTNPYNSVPLSQPLPGFPVPKYVEVGQQKQETKVTVLENGLRVASENKFGPFCTVGVLIDSGSRYEVAYPSGISHFLEKLAFQSTKQYNREEILQILEKYGGICDCVTSRDTLIYAMSAESRALPLLSNILAEATLTPNISQEELTDTKTMLQFELEAVHQNPDPEPLLIEMSHAAAYRGNTLGLPKLCPLENISKIDRETLLTYMHHVHTPERMVVAGVGVDHDELVRSVKEAFLTKQPTWKDNFEIINQSLTCDKSVAQYTGGKVLVEKDLSKVSLGPNPMPELAHLVIGLESCSHKDDDFVAFCVLNMLLGGGSAFSSGGPGKGMYTRLYLNVLNRHHWINSASAINHAYDDSGFFCIQASSHPDQLKELTEIITKELLNTAGPITTDELNRAKTQLQSMVLMNLEARPVMFEDVGRQVLASGHRKQAEYYFDAIGKITADDLKRVADRMLKTRLTLVGYGSLHKLPSYEDIESHLMGKGPLGFVQRKLNMLRGKQTG